MNIKESMLRLKIMQSIVVYKRFNLSELIRILLISFERIKNFPCLYYKKNKKNKSLNSLT